MEENNENVVEQQSAVQDGVKDGVILMYVKDGVIYPVALRPEQHNMLQMMAKVFEPVQVIFDQPQGTAVNLVDGGDE